MILDVQFEENSTALAADFGEITDFNADMYGKGYEAGYGEGKDVGYSEGYEKGKTTAFDTLESIPVTATGTQAVSVHDVSEIPHNVTVQLSSDAITDFSGVTVTRAEKNLFNKYYLLPVTTDYKYRSGLLEDGTIYVPRNAISSDRTLKELAPGLKTGETYILTATSTGDYKYIWLKQAAISWTFGTTLTITEAHLNSVVYFYSFGGDKINESAIVTDMQIEVGGVATEYAPYISETYSPSQNGIVTGVTPTRQHMTIFVDNPSVSLTIGYNRSWGMQAERDRFWDRFQDNGKRTIYSYAFYYSCWGDFIFTPKYDIVPTNASDMFGSSRITDLKGILERQGVVLDFKNCTMLLRAFSGADRMTRLPCIDMSNAVDIRNVFMNCYLLQSVDSLVFSETTGTQYNSTAMVQNCRSLRDLVAKGVIWFSVNFQWCPLSVASMKSIISCLKNYAGTENDGAYTVRFSDTCWAALESDSTAPDGGTWKDYVRNLGWTL